MVPLLGAALSALPLLTKIPSAVSAIAGLFGGDTARKIESTANNMDDFVSTVSEAITGPQATPEQQMAFVQIFQSHEIEIRRMKMEETKAFLQQEAELQETARVMLQSEDQEVRRTRPGILRKHFWLVAVQTVGMVVIYVVLAAKTDLKTAAASIKLVPEEMWDLLRANIISFSANYGGYAVVRSVWDKRGKEVPGPLEKMVGVLYGKKPK